MNVEYMNRAKLDAAMGELATLLGEIVHSIRGFEEQGTKDLSNVLNLILNHWEDVFKHGMLRCGVDYRFLDKVRRIRNCWAHRSARYQDIQATNEDLDALKSLQNRLRSFKSHGRVSRRCRGNVWRRNVKRGEVIKRGAKPDVVVVGAVFVIVLLVTVLIGNNFLSESTSGTVGFLIALVVALLVYIGLKGSR